MSNNKEVALITGASSGIGWELAKLFAADGCELVLVARSQEKLEQLASELKAAQGTESMVIPLDLTAPGAAQKLFATMQEAGKEIEVLVNNAGFGQFGKFEEVELDRYEAMCQLNMVVLTQLTYLFLKPMLQRNRGAILNIGSTASFQPGPNSAVYYATKGYVLSFSEAVHAELWGSNVSVTCLCPGPTRTGFGQDSGMESAPIFKYNSMDVTTVAKAGYQGLRKRKRVVMPGLLNNILAFSNRFTAKPVLLRVMKRLQPLK